jgi:PAS domain S-box-containing protein
MITVLYVDDEPDLLEVAKLFLERNKEFRVGTVTSAERALEILGNEHYDAVISDYQMPGMNGIELLKAVREQFGDLPFIIFTGRGREEVVIQALNDGVDFYLHKGGDAVSQFAELAHKVKQAVGQRRALASIQEHERREADIINFLPDATFAIDKDEVVIAWNRAIERLTGVKPEDIVGKGDYEYAIPFYNERRPILIDLVIKDDPATAAKYPSITREGNKLKSEIHLPHFNDGQGADLWFTASPLYDTQGNIIGAIESIREITDRKKVEQALNESEKRYRELSDLLPQVVFEAGADGRLVYANRIAFETFGYNVEDLENGVHVPDLIAPGDRERVSDLFVRMVEGDFLLPAGSEFMAQRRDGSTFPISIYASPVTRNQERVGLRGIAIDITERTRAEEMIRESEQNYRLLFENAIEGILVAEGDRLVHANPALVSLLDRPAEEITSRPFTDFIHPDDREKVVNRHLLRMKGEKPTTGYTFRIVTGSGEERWVRINSTGMEWSGSLASLSFINDITEQKRAEMSLIQADREYTNLLNQIQDVYYRTDTKGTLVKASQSWADLLGYDDPSECLGRRVEEFWLNPGERDVLVEEIHRKGKVTNYEVALKKKGGTPVIIETNSHLHFGGSGEILGIEGIFRDVTERKVQESILGTQLELGLTLQKTRGMHETMEACLDAAIAVSGMDSGGIYLVDEVDGSVDLILARNLGDDFLKRASQYPPESPQARIVMRGEPYYLPFSELESLRSPLQEEEGFRSFACIPIVADGHTIGCLNVGSHVRTGIPETARFALETIATQIFAVINRIKAEEALAGSEERYRNVVEDQTEFISRFLPDGTHVFVNDAYCRYFGFAREEILGHRFRPKIASVDAGRVDAFFESLTPDHPIGTIEHRIVMPDGSRRWHLWSDRAIFGPDGTIMEYQSVGRDITETKKAELALTESEAYYRSLSEASNDLIFMIDRDDTVTYVNKSAAEMLGRSPREIIGSRRSSLFPDAVSDHQREAIERVFERGEQIRSTGQITFGGVARWFDHSLVPVRDTEGTITRVLGVSRDITDQKRIEEELQRKTDELESRNRLLTTLLETIPIGIFMVEAPSGRPIVTNREAARLLGRGTLPDATGETLAAVYETYRAGTSTRYPTGEMPIVRGMKGESSHIDDMVVRRPDGSEVRIEVFGTPVTSREGQVRGSLVSFIDITDRKRAEETIRSLAQFPEENPYPVIRLAADGTLLYANTPGRAWLEALEHHEGALPGIIQEILTEVLEDEGIYFVEIDDAYGRVYEVTAIRPENERYVNLYASDITELRRAERAIRDANEKIGLLTSITRHDVANQVAILKGFTELALMNDPEPVIADALRKIDTAGSMITRQIEFTRAYQELGHQAPGWFSVMELVRSHAPGNLRVSCTCDRKIYGDPMLENVFFNLFDNTTRHGIRATGISVHCREDSDGLVVIIEDDGVGVPRKDKTRIFEKGFGSNTGFGLSLAQEILSITGIAIRETGDPGSGARFELHVPKGNYRTGSGDVPG